MEARFARATLTGSLTVGVGDARATDAIRPKDERAEIFIAVKLIACGLDL